MKEVLDLVYNAMAEKGYNPVNQIVGYIMSQVVAADPVRQLIHPVTAAAHQKIDLRLVSRQLMNSQNSEQHQRQ